MNWRAVGFSGGTIVLAALVWEFSPALFERVGLGAFDPLAAICAVFVVLSLAESIMGRVMH